MGIRLVALDVDGTLTSGAHEISAHNREAIARAQAQGVFVTVATGRGYYASRGIWGTLNIRGPVIQYGGAMIMDTRTGKPIHVEALDPETVRDIMRFAHEIGVHAQLYQGDTVVFEKANAFTERYCAKLGLPSREDTDIHGRLYQDVPKILAYVDPAVEAETRAKFSAFIGDRAGVSKSQPGYIEINCPTATKARALAVISDYLSIARDEVAALGDSYLDMDMIAWAGDGVCVANGLPEVKAIADRIVPACDDDGVAYYIEHFVLKS